MAYYVENEMIHLSDFALFQAVMRIKEAYECVLSIILEEDDLQLREVKVEQVILNESGKRAIRLDAWAVDRRNRQFNVEMQNDSRKDHLPKRSRFYQSLLDSPILKAGKQTKYRHLPATAIVFITQEDIFGKDSAKYTFSEQCEEVERLPLGDGTQKIFLNMNSMKGDSALVSLLQYMKNSTLDNKNRRTVDPRLRRLDEIVREVKQTEEWEEFRMTIWESAHVEGRKAGRREGRREGRIEGRQQGIALGIVQGEAFSMIDLVLKKIAKGKSVERITDELEADRKLIEQIFQCAKKYPEADKKEIYKLMNS